MMIYVAHRGDDVVAIGTLDEVANQLGISEKTVKCFSAKAYSKIWAKYPNGKRLVADRVVIED